MDRKYYLIMSSQPDSKALRAAAEHLKTFPLWRDSGAKITTHEEFMAMIEKGEIEPPPDYWTIRPKQVGIVIAYGYEKYSTTWELIATCKSDFMDGWRACEESKKGD